jgi:hypothetical protein
VAFRLHILRRKPVWQSWERMMKQFIIFSLSIFLSGCSSTLVQSSAADLTPISDDIKEISDNAYSCLPAIDDPGPIQEFSHASWARVVLRDEEGVDSTAFLPNRPTQLRGQVFADSAITATLSAPPQNGQNDYLGVARVVTSDGKVFATQTMECSKIKVSNPE